MRGIMVRSKNNLRCKRGLAEFKMPWYQGAKQAYERDSCDINLVILHKGRDTIQMHSSMMGYFGF